MAITIFATDKSTGYSAEVDTADGEAQGLVVATRPLKTFTPVNKFMTNPTYGRDMDVNGAFGGTPLLIHNGTDDVAWTMSEPVGTKWVADSTDRFHSGTKALKCDNPDVGDIMQVINNVGPGNNIDMTGAYVALSMWINVDKDWVLGDEFELYAHVDGALVGNVVNLEDYFDYTVYDVWQFVSIPLTDLGIATSTIDAFRIRNAARVGKSPKFYIDDWYLQESGTPVKFTVEPNKSTWLYVTEMRALFVDEVKTDTPDVISLSYNKVLSVTLTNGFLFERYQSGLNIKPLFSIRVLNLADILMTDGWRIENVGSDTVNTFLLVTYKLPAPMILKSEDLDRLQVTIDDNLAAFVRFNMSVSGYEEAREL